MKYSREDFEASKFLGFAAGLAEPFLKKISCMNIENREIYAYLEILGLWFPPETEQEKKDLALLKETIQRIGQANFQMDVISHLSMKADVSDEEEEWE